MSNRKPCNYAVLVPAYVVGSIAGVLALPLYLWESRLRGGVGSAWRDWKRDGRQYYADARADAEHLAERELSRMRRRER